MKFLWLLLFSSCAHAVPYEEWTAGRGTEFQPRGEQMSWLAPRTGATFEERDCSAGVPVSGHMEGVHTMGPVAIGQNTADGRDFAPLMFFGSVDQALACDPDSEIRILNRYTMEWEVSKGQKPGLKDVRVSRHLQ